MTQAGRTFRPTEPAGHLADAVAALDAPEVRGGPPARSGLPVTLGALETRFDVSVARTPHWPVLAVS